MSPSAFRPTLLVVFALLSATPSLAAETPSIRWRPETLVLIQPGAGYARMRRLSDGSILCAYSRRRTIYVRRSEDEGRAWGDESLAVRLPGVSATNAELLVLRDGRVLLLYNERPYEEGLKYAIGVCESVDGGRTWTDHRRLYTAGTEFIDGCWEPAAVETPDGEIHLFFANEWPYRSSNEQEITRIRSRDGGRSWTEPETFCFRAGHRDGMPVPIVLHGKRRLAVAIEDNGLLGRFKPSIVQESGGDRGRSGALAEPLEEHVYAGAPYLAQFPSGETVLSVQSTEGRGEPHSHENSRMVVYVGDATAAGFTNRSVPFASRTDVPGLWNSLFIKDGDTVTAISGTTIDGVRGIWAIDGKLQRP